MSGVCTQQIAQNLLRWDAQVAYSTRKLRLPDDAKRGIAAPVNGVLGVERGPRLHFWG
jgi:hypothetical protein